MLRQLDIVLINPGDKRQVYQTLADDYSATEPPFWPSVMASYLRNNGISVEVIDSNAENYTADETAAEISRLNPLLTVVVVYGSQPSASTQNMTISGKICKAVKEGTRSLVALGGLHPSALPRQTITEEGVDFVIEGEGFTTLIGLINVLKNRGDYSKVAGLWYYDNGVIRHNKRAELLHDLDVSLPMAAWDLLPMAKYKAHNWHCFDDINNRMPYGAIYTSLGCPFSCVFCCINAPFGGSGIRYRSPQLVIEEIGVLVDKYGIKNIKIIDELFVLRESHYMTIVDLIIQRGYDLNIWAYARVDTVKAENLKKMKKAGINWLALGIESANPEVRDGAEKKMRVKDIKHVVETIQNEGIRVIGNYIFGLPDDTIDTMQETLDLAIDLRCEFANFYCAMAYPGSRLYEIAVKERWVLPKMWHGYSQHSYEIQPLPTKYISAAEVLRFRDQAFHIYFEDLGYREMIEDKFSKEVRSHIEGMTKTRLKRKLLENGN
ncbi:MAG: cobalamin-dependent protein [Nitrospirae bacterium]|nr:cobalamin-dependent protein [Nitrospirota bacterium]